MPQATTDDPQIPGVSILSSRDAGGSNRWEFKINQNDVDSAIGGLLDWLDDGRTFSLTDHSRGDFESCATYERNGAKFIVSLGGHGWSAGKQVLDRDSAFAAARDQSKYNHGPGWENSGHLTESKRKQFAFLLHWWRSLGASGGK